jgi:hypothetical protein
MIYKVSMYYRKFTGFEPAVLETHERLEDFNFDEIEEGGQDEI